MRDAPLSGMFAFVSKHWILVVPVGEGTKLFPDVSGALRFALLEDSADITIDGYPAHSVWL